MKLTLFLVASTAFIASGHSSLAGLHDDTGREEAEEHRFPPYNSAWEEAASARGTASPFFLTLTAGAAFDMPNFQYDLALWYYYGKEGVRVDKERAFKLFKRAAQQGLGAAQNNLAAMYYYGEGIPKPDKEAALTWFRQAAKKGYARAQLNLDRLFKRRSK